MNFGFDLQILTVDYLIYLEPKKDPENDAEIPIKRRGHLGSRCVYICIYWIKIEIVCLDVEQLIMCKKIWCPWCFFWLGNIFETLDFDVHRFFFYGMRQGETSNNEAVWGNQCILPSNCQDAVREFFFIAFNGSSFSKNCTPKIETVVFIGRKRLIDGFDKEGFIDLHEGLTMFDTSIV